MASRQDWLDTGVAVLAEQGARALTIDQLSARLGLSKGSFYHHFKGMGGFKTALLAHFEIEYTDRYIDAAEARTTGAPMAKLVRLLEIVSAKDHHQLETAIRAWALQDPEVRATQERVDRTRIDYLRSVWTQVTGDAAEASRMAYVLYLVLVGAGHVIPAVPPEKLRPIYDLILRRA